MISTEKSMKFCKENVLFIRAKGDAAYYGLREYGYVVVDPYKGYSLVPRILREICFRLKLPFCDAWYNKKATDGFFDNIIVYDPLITKEYLLWLMDAHPESGLVFFYGNLIGQARHIYPDDIPYRYSVWTYDAKDAKKYGIKLNDRIFISDHASKISKVPSVYDVLYVGRDKGRSEYLLRLEREMNSLGLKTCFHIVADNPLLQFFRINDYKPKISYAENLHMVAGTRAILNFTVEGQEGITIRDMEAMVNNIKLVTNNISIQNRDFYHPANIFLLGKDRLEELSSFLDIPFHPLPSSFFAKNSVHGWLDLMLRKDEYPSKFGE